MGLSTGGEGSGSMFSYQHVFDYSITPNLRARAELELSRYGSDGKSRTELTPELKLDWEIAPGTRMSLDLRLPPQHIAGDSPYGESTFRRFVD